MSEVKNENGIEKKKGGKGKTIGAVIVVVLLVVIIQSCFDSSNLPEEQEPVTTNQSEQESESETTETESTETESTETETLSEEMFEELEAEEGRYINPGETYSCDDGDRDYILYANIFPEDDLSVRFVGFAKTKDGTALPEMNLDIILSSTDAINYTDGTYTLIYDEYGDGIQFWNTVDDSDDFYGQFFPVVDENASNSSDDVVYLSEDRQMLQNFVRDESNVGKTVSITVTIDTTFENYFHALIGDIQGGSYYEIIVEFTNNENCPVLFSGDTVTVTGIYTGYDASGIIHIDTLSVQ